VSALPRYTVRAADRTIGVEPLADGRLRVDGHDAPFTVEADGDSAFIVSDGTTRWRVATAGSADAIWVSVGGESALVDVATGAEPATRKRRSAHGEAAAPMPATVIAILVVPDQTVSAGDIVVKLEAMKMELPVRAPRAGTVRAIRCQVGELVQPGIVLVDIT
jgi:3-methylcrotonyl-CoA carboxylase alpha subunit